MPIFMNNFGPMKSGAGCYEEIVGRNGKTLPARALSQFIGCFPYRIRRCKIVNIATECLELRNLF